MTRKEAIKILEGAIKKPNTKDGYLGQAIDIAINSLEIDERYELEYEQAEPKTAHWIWELEDWNKWTCSECGFSKRTDIHVKLGYKYCPSCGCKMAESEDKE